MTISLGKSYIKVAFWFSLALGVVGIQIYNSLQPPYTCEAKSVNAVYGDTLWYLAERYCEGQISLAVDDMVERYGTTIYPNDLIELPTHSD